MKVLRKCYLFFMLPMLLIGCKESYRPEVTLINSNLLVVEGLINTGADSTIIKLSRTVVVSNKNSSVVEKGATITVEGEAGETFPLVEKTPGNYVSAALGLNSSRKYRVRIKTLRSVTYLSDFVSAKVSPPIDDIPWEVKGDGLQFYVNTHDPTNNSKYYKWEFTETWNFTALYNSKFICDGDKVVLRNLVNNDIYSCWAGNTSKNIFLGSTNKLDQDVIYRSPLGFIGSDSEKIEIKYSMLLTQTVLTKEAYEFWENLKKNTESLGSIFDAQPSQLTGNIHNVADSEEPVIGYIGAGTTQKKRMFVDRSEIPRWQPKYPYLCDTPIVVPIKDDDYLFRSFKLIPVAAVYSLQGVLLGHTGSPKECVDCTIRGTNRKPIFWQ